MWGEGLEGLGPRRPRPAILVLVSRNSEDGETTIKIFFSPFEGGVRPWGQRGKSSKTLFFFRRKRHGNKILKVQISGWSRFGSVRLRFVGRFERFPFSAPTVHLWKGIFLFQYGFSTVPVPVSVPEN